MAGRWPMHADLHLLTFGERMLFCNRMVVAEIHYPSQYAGKRGTHEVRIVSRHDLRCLL